MAIEPKLNAVAELAFEVARTGIESTPSLPAPAPMRSFLYIAKLPMRALTVALQVLDGDDEFRARVAEVAEPTTVGRAGWLYVARPEGWQEQYDEVVRANGRDEIPVPPRPSAGTGSAESPPVAPPPPPTTSSAAIESELHELKNLVERLTVERQQVSASVADMESDYEQRAERGDQVSGRLAELEAELAEVRTERDEAVSRLVRAETEAVTLRAADSPTMNERDAARDALDAATARLHDTTIERDTLRAELDELRTEQQRLVTRLEGAREERDEARNQLAEARAARDDALLRLSDAEQARDDARAEAQRLGAEWDGIQSQVAELREQRQLFALELDRVAQVEATQRELVSGLSQRLDDVQGERDRLIQKLRVAEARIGGTREAFVEATNRLRGDLDAAEMSVVESTGEAEALSTSIDRTARFGAKFSDTFLLAPIEAADVADDEAHEAPQISDPALAAIESVLDKPGDVSLTVTPEEYFADDPDPLDEYAVDDETPDDEMSDGALADDPQVEPLDTEAEMVDDDAVDLGEALAGMADDHEEIADDPADDHVDLGEALAGVEPDDTVDIAGAIEPPPFGGFRPTETDLGFSSADTELDSALASSDVVDVAGTLDAALPSGFGIDAAPVDPITASAPSAAADAVPAAETMPAGFTAEPPSAVVEVAPIAATSVGTTQVGARHQVPMPDDVAADPASRARTLVAAENAILLVDGDAVASLGWPSLGVAERRDALVDYLGDLVDDHATAVDVVFDGGVGDDTTLPVRPSVRIRLTKPETRPAVALSELVDAYPAQWPVTVATDNANLELVARDKGASVVTNGDLLDLFLD